MPVKRAESRKKTPWDGVDDLTAAQEFSRLHCAACRADRRRAAGDGFEAGLINSRIPAKRPCCASGGFKKGGRARSCMRGACGKTLSPAAGTVFDDREISAGEWMECCLNLLRHAAPQRIHEAVKTLLRLPAAGFKGFSQPLKPFRMTQL
ncbi:MAG: hypothetical protein LBU32_30390 [Clostridiales bacterium]|jgi:hypothetical protein|nr:hypothetical protein [Clostridiales bacterium]